MDNKLKVPPIAKERLTSPKKLAAKLGKLIGLNFPLTGKSRTDGSNVRKLVGATLLDNNPPNIADDNLFSIIPPKGVPKILLEYVDTYIVTSGTTYNLQVWNRNPSSESVQIQYLNGETLKSNEVRFVLVKIDPEKNIIGAIAVLTPEYIVSNFGSFGKPTVKNQLIITSTAREQVLNCADYILFYDDDICIGSNRNTRNLQNISIHDEPTSETLLPLSAIKEIVTENIIGKSIAPGATKNRGQMLESVLATALGYKIQEGELLAGGYPDIANQALEIKIQDSPTVDLGKYSPEFEKKVPNCKGFTTRSIRYLIALTNPETNIIEGVILCPGNKLGLHFTYVARESFKCQRSIPMNFFDRIKGSSVFNPVL